MSSPEFAKSKKLDRWLALCPIYPGNWYWVSVWAEGRIVILVVQPRAGAVGCPTKQLVLVVLTNYREDHATPSGSVPIGIALKIFRVATSMKVSSFAFALVIYARRPSDDT